MPDPNQAGNGAAPSKLRVFVMFAPMAVFLAAAVASLVDLETFFAVASAANDWILAQFSGLIAWAVFGFVLTCIGIFLSPLGGVRIGGHDAEKLLGFWSWFAITLCTTIAIGILFWAMAEPMFHLYQPGGEARGIEPGSEAARRFSLISLFMNWSVSPYAIYTVAALAFALAYHNLGAPSSVSGPLGVLIGRPVPQAVSAGLDAVILWALVMGMAASMGAGMLLLAGGISSLTGVPSGPFLLAMVAGAIGFVVLISSLTGLMKGIRILSLINAGFFVFLVGFLILFGPAADMVGEGGRAVIGYFREFVDRSLLVGEARADRDWAKGWTIFYFANWLAWAPVTAMFLGRIARGYTVRAFIGVNLILPSLFSIVWMSVFGVFAMDLDRMQDGVLKQTLDTAGAEAVLFRALDFAPYAGVMVPVLLVLAFMSYVTAADSNTEAISQICKTQPAGAASDELVKPTAPLLKISWVVLLCVVAWIMVAFSGIDGVRMLSNVGGLPALFVVIGLQAALIRMVFQAERLSRGQAGQGRPA